MHIRTYVLASVYMHGYICTYNYAYIYVYTYVHMVEFLCEYEPSTQHSY